MLAKQDHLITIQHTISIMGIWPNEKKKLKRLQKRLMKDTQNRGNLRHLILSGTNRTDEGIFFLIQPFY